MRLTPSHPTPEQRLAALRRAGYQGPAYLRGRPVHEYVVPRRRRSLRQAA